MADLLFKVDPEPDESCMGWVLRTSKANFLRSPWALFRHAGLSQSNMCVLHFDTAKLAALSGVDRERLEAIACCESSTRAAHVSFRGHTISRRLVRNREPCVCPLCLAQRPIAPAAWDLNLMVACPMHRVNLISRCQACGQKLSWLRPDVNTCRCGARISDTPAPSASPGAVIASAAVEVSLARDAAAWRASESPDPALLAQWASMPLSHLAWSVYELAKLVGGFSAHIPRCEFPGVMASAGSMMKGWPTTLHEALQTYTQRRAQHSKLRLRHGRAATPADILTLEIQVYETYCRRVGFAANDYLIDEMLRFQQSRHGEAGCDPRRMHRLATAGVEPEWLGIAEAARRLNVHPATMRDMVADSRVESCVVQSGRVDRVLIKTSSLRPSLQPAQRVAIRLANRMTGLPLTLLRRLCELGTLSQGHEGPCGSLLSMREVCALKEKWEQLPVARRPRNMEAVDLQTALRWKLRNHQIEWKAQLVRHVLCGQIPVYSKTTQPVLNATLARADTIAVRAGFENVRLGLGYVATKLHLSSLGVVELVASRLLRPKFEGDRVSFEADDLRQFQQRYVRLSTIAKGIPEGEALAQECTRSGVGVWRAQSNDGTALFAEHGPAAAALQRLKARLGRRLAGLQQVASHDATTSPRLRGKGRGFADPAPAQATAAPRKSAPRRPRAGT